MWVEDMRVVNVIDFDILMSIVRSGNCYVFQGNFGNRILVVVYFCDSNFPIFLFRRRIVYHDVFIGIY